MDVNKEFSSWESFMNTLEQYAKENKVVYVVGTCKPVEAANKNDSLKNKFPLKFKYCFARMLCKHYGNYSSRSAGQRPHQRTCKTGCTSSILVSVNKKRTALVIKEVNLQHTHDVSADIFSKYSQNRRLQGEERRMASILLRAGVPLSRVQEFISNACSKNPTIKDLQNIKVSMKGSLPDNEGHEFAFLTDLDQLMAKDPASIVEIINFDLVPGAIYFQTSEMTERIKLLQDGRLQIVTHDLNEGKMSVVSIIGIDTELNPHILAFCIIVVGADTTFQYFMEAFIKNNSSFCDSVKGVVLDCNKDNAEFVQQMIPQADIAWSKSYILDRLLEKSKASVTDIEGISQLYKEIINADREEVYDCKIKEVRESLSGPDMKQFLRTWDSCKEMWVQYEISPCSGLQHQKAAVEMDYLNSLTVFVKASMNLSDLIKALLRFDRSEEPEECQSAQEQPSFKHDSSCDLYKNLCFPEASESIICQIVVACSSVYEIKELTDMIFVKKKDTQEEFVLDISGSKCSCHHFLETDLPCQHIFAWLKFSNKSLYNESLIPAKWQVFGKAITLDALAESLAQGYVPSSLQHDERLKELQSVLKDTLTSCCSHSYLQMGEDLVLLKQILNIMRSCSSQKTTLVSGAEEFIGKENNLSGSSSIEPPPRRRGRPSKKDMQQKQQKESQITDPTMASPQKPQIHVPSTPSRHNLRTNIKHKFVTRGVHFDSEADSAQTENVKSKNVSTEMITGNVVSSVVSEDRTELLRTIRPKSETTDELQKSTEVNSSREPESKEVLNDDGNKSALGKSNSTDKFAKLVGSRHLLDYNEKLQARYKGRKSLRGRRPSSYTDTSRLGMKRPHSEVEESSTDNESDDEESSDDDNDIDDLEIIEAKRSHRQKQIEIFIESIPDEQLKEVVQVSSMLESPEDRAQIAKERGNETPAYPADVLIRTCQKYTEDVDFIIEQIKKKYPGFEKYPYQVAACITCRAFQTNVLVSDLLQTVSDWPSHLPEFPNSRPISPEITLNEGQTLTVCGHKLDQKDMDTLSPEKEISSEALHAYLEVLAQKHSSKMFVIPFEVISLWRNGKYTEKIFKRVHFKTFEYLVLPIHCGAEFSALERKKGELITPKWMALVADVNNRTVGVLNPMNEDRYAIAANGYMLQWRRYMQIRSVHTGEMLSSWTSKKLECSKLENEYTSGVSLLMNVEALINNVSPVVMTEAHIQRYLHFVTMALRDMDRETTVLCVGGPECQQLAARDADWLQCENCRTWWHRACAGHSNTYLAFYCTSCQQRIINVKGKGAKDEAQDRVLVYAEDEGEDEEEDEAEEEDESREMEGVDGEEDTEVDQEMIEEGGDNHSES